MNDNNIFMKRLYRLVVILTLLVSFGCLPLFGRQSQEISVTLQVFSPGISDTASVFVAGSLPELGLWNPAKVRMQSTGNQVWQLKFVVDKPNTIEYKFTLGSWDREAANANGLPLQNFTLNISRDTTLRHDILFWKSQKPIASQDTGTVAYHRQLKGDDILPRDIIVWLPPDYEKNKKQRYPVVYMHDGQNIMDPATSAFGVDWRVDESCDSLIRSNIIKPVIMVGIYNTSNRSKEYTPGNEGQAYMKFIVRKLKPLIDSTYRTRPDRKSTIVGGSSAGGLISFMLAWEYPSVFSKAICMSPAFKIMHIDYVKTVLETKGKKDVFFYIDNGGIGLESQLQPGIDAMVTALNQKGYKQSKDYSLIIDHQAKHFEADWAKRFPGALRLCFK
jgi:predicted alpha/beta superfamily hydrolase